MRNVTKGKHHACPTKALGSKRRESKKLADPTKTLGPQTKYRAVMKEGENKNEMVLTAGISSCLAIRKI